MCIRDRFQLVLVETLSLVVPETLDTIDILSPAILLNNVDFPTFGLPIIETIIFLKNLI